MFPIELCALRAEAQVPADLTTLGRTIAKGSRLRAGTLGGYYALSAGPGEPHIIRTELGTRTAAPVRRSLVHFAQFTDIHVVDTQSPTRVEFLDRLADPGNGCSAIPFDAAFRPHETMTLQVMEAMVRQVRAVATSPVTGAPIAFAVCTGDNTDDEQYNELRWFIDTMDGAASVSNNSGSPDYEGVQATTWGDPDYWIPEPGGTDKYKAQWGFPSIPGLLAAAVKPFPAVGVGVPWYQTFGNHDGLLQGNAPNNPVFAQLAVGTSKPNAVPPGINPCDSFDTLRNNPAAFLTSPAKTVTADPKRRILPRAEYVAEMFKTAGTPAGHGFTARNQGDGTAYWHTDAYPGFRFISLDTVNPGGYSEGSIGQTQFTWLEDRVKEVSSRYLDSTGASVSNASGKDRLVILFSHHGLRSLTNRAAAPNANDPGANDLPRILSDQIEPMLHRYPNVIAWVNGHTHQNIVAPRPAAAGNGGFWDVGTAAHIDWNCQSRLIEVVDNQDGTLSILGTMVDHAGDIVPGGTDPVLRLASIARELCANDYQYGFGSKGAGSANDRNVELVIKAPFRIAAAPTPKPTATPTLVNTSSAPGDDLALGAVVAAGAAALVASRLVKSEDH